MKRYSLKMPAWPEADRTMWERIVKGGDLLRDAGPGAQWAVETKRVNARDYGYWLSFVLTVLRAVHERPTARVTPERVQTYCGSMADVSARTRSSRIASLHTVIRGADPALDLRWLAEVRRVLERAARRQGPARSKHGRLLPSGTLFEAGLDLLKRAHNDDQLPPKVRAQHVRDGLMIALLASRPLRIKNFASLRVGRHLHETSSGFFVDIPGSETKTGLPIETFVPEELCPWLKEYLINYRPILLAGHESDYLWVHGKSHSYRPGALSLRIAKLTKRLVGVSISPHLFRDCAATTIATEDPEHVMIIAPLLGHTTLRTAEKHYNHARSLEASRRFQNSIREMRSLARPITRRSSSA